AKSPERNSKPWTPEVPERAPEQRQACRPRTSLHHSMIAVKPNIGVLGVRKSLEARIAFEAARGPFPHIAAHVQTSICAGAIHISIDRYRAPVAKPKVPVIARRVTPTKPAL